MDERAKKVILQMAEATLELQNMLKDGGQPALKEAAERLADDPAHAKHEDFLRGFVKGMTMSRLRRQKEEGDKLEGDAP